MGKTFHCKFFQVIQRRYNGEINFYRNWTDYKYGFGSVDNEIWLGKNDYSDLTFVLEFFNPNISSFLFIFSSKYVRDFLIR